MFRNMLREAERAARAGSPRAAPVKELVPHVAVGYGQLGVAKRAREQLDVESGARQRSA
jgi:hypothetical protein